MPCVLLPLKCCNEMRARDRKHHLEKSLAEHLARTEGLLPTRQPISMQTQLQSPATLFYHQENER